MRINKVCPLFQNGSPVNGQPFLDVSSYEKRTAALREEIALLEAENVGPKDWVLMGEANSRARPQNSLLEEDLEFERIMKAVPMTTTESIQQLEDRIKARIIQGRFDDVVRIRPVDDKPFLPSRLVELQDTKSAQSLAQIYEDEYVATQDGAIIGCEKDAKLLQEHKAIEAQWEIICSKLDALCNAHFVPKLVKNYLQEISIVLTTPFRTQPLATISTINNTSTVNLESALPTTTSATMMLTPEEVYAPRTLTSQTKNELSPAEKKALFNKNRKLRKKTRDQLAKSVDKFARTKKISTKKQKEAALSNIIKSSKGITVIGKESVEKVGKKGKRI